ncbi:MULTISPECIES: type III secretion system protein SctP [unclassified Burkholderia]|uniref:type III secretion system protein SctP n=1 Tax=unclassified Burkholderia TaxID=2613784 RepID=UPI0021503318|nr:MULTISPECIES: type III secretion system protein SctP [unclassified Burkholderia]MCR4469766.1 type III secretion system protein SctP [Burkholderia sp. SCN-KJ]
MTRIRSTREIRITPPVPPRTDTAPHTADRCVRSSVSSETDPDVQRFGLLYDAARQRSSNGEEDQTSGHGSPDDNARDDGFHQDAHADTSSLDGAAALDTPPSPLPVMPPLPPLHPLSGALMALRKGRRASVADSGGTANASGRRMTREHPPDSHDAIPDELFGIQMVRRCARAAEGDLLAQHLAEQVAGFCTSPAVRRTGQWEIAVELDPSILPRTQLHLSLSGSALTLRFDSRDPRARQLICDNGNELKTRLQARLDSRIAVEVTVL